MRSTDHDCAAHRRAPPILTFNMVRGAPNGNVSCCSKNAARASLTVDGPSAAMDPAVFTSELNGDEGLDLRLRLGKLQIARSSCSSGSRSEERRVGKECRS